MRTLIAILKQFSICKLLSFPGDKKFQRSVFFFSNVQLILLVYSDYIWQTTSQNFFYLWSCTHWSVLTHHLTASSLWLFVSSILFLTVTKTDFVFIPHISAAIQSCPSAQCSFCFTWRSLILSSCHSISLFYCWVVLFCIMHHLSFILHQLKERHWSVPSLSYCK